MSAIANESEHRACLQRAFRGNSPDTYIRMDGQTARNNFLRENWNFAIEKGWVRTKEIELEQETFFKGYLTDKGREELGLEVEK